MNAIVPFSFDSHQVRVVTDDNGEPWFNAKDVCAVLEFGNYRQAIETHVDQEDVQPMDTLTAGGKQTANHINESGLFALILGSRKPEAKRFKKWVTSEVLPSIRKTGGYRAKPAPAPNVGLSQLRQAKALELVVNMAERLSARFPNLSNVSEQALFASVINPVVGREIIPLPVVAKTYTATQIGEMLGVSANQIGRWANANGLKTDEFGRTVLGKAAHSNKQVEEFHYYEAGVQRLREIQAFSDSLAKH